MSLPVFFLYDWKAELKMKSRLEREGDGVGVEDIMALEGGIVRMVMNE
jgi:hypothetical protein